MQTVLLHSHTEFDANRLIICRVIALERFLLCVETCQLLWLSYYKITSKLDTNVPLGINHLHESLTIKKTPGQKNSKWPPKIQNGRHDFSFFIICSSAVNKSDILKEHNKLINSF